MARGSFVAAATKSVEVLTKATNRPFRLMLGDFELPLPLAVPTALMLTNAVVLERRLRAKISDKKFWSGSAVSLARLSKTTKLPSSEICGLPDRWYRVRPFKPESKVGAGAFP